MLQKIFADFLHALYSRLLAAISSSKRDNSGKENFILTVNGMDLHRVSKNIYFNHGWLVNCSREMCIKNGAQRQPPRKEKWHNCTSKYFALLLLTLLSTLQGLSGKSGETLKGFTGLRTLDRSWIGSKVRT